jgi:hypothetical protein
VRAESTDGRTSALPFSCSYAACNPFRRSSAWCSASRAAPVSCSTALGHISSGSTRGAEGLHRSILQVTWRSCEVHQTISTIGRLCAQPQHASCPSYRSCPGNAGLMCDRDSQHLFPAPLAALLTHEQSANIARIAQGGRMRLCSDSATVGSLQMSLPVQPQRRRPLTARERLRL